jgi:D-3-phosphoglycerate dehydrogenase
MKSEIFEEVIKKKLSDHVISFTKKDVEWPDGPFHNDYGKGHFSNIKEYFGNEDDVINTVKDNEILITDLAPITENIINKIPNLKFIGVSRGGPVNIDIEACKKNNITVVNAPGRNASAVAEFTIASILSETRLVTKGHQSMVNGEWRGDLYRFDITGRELSELTIGLVGYSHIGKRVRDLLLPFGCKIIFSDPFVEEDEIDKKNNIERVTKEDLILRSDVISIHARVTKETEKFFSENEFSKMKKGSYFINTARGPLVDYDALLKYLKNQHLGGAALDTFDIEPLPKDHPLRRLNNVTLSPHIAGASIKTVYYAAEVIAEDLKNYLENKELINKIC